MKCVCDGDLYVSYTVTDYSANIKIDVLECRRPRGNAAHLAAVDRALCNLIHRGRIDGCGVTTAPSAVSTSAPELATGAL